MMKKEFNQMLDNMSYEQQKDLMKRIEQERIVTSTPTVIEVVVDAFVNAIGAVIRIISNKEEK